MKALDERPLRILAADDSAVMRGVMGKLFRTHAEDRSSELPRMELCGVAQDGVDFLEAVKIVTGGVSCVNCRHVHGLVGGAGAAEKDPAGTLVAIAS